MIKIYNGDCLEVMSRFKDKSFDAIITDPPYGTTTCKWDSIIPLESMWEQLKRVIKPNGAIVMTASQPFTATLIASNMKMFKYCWAYQKTKATNFFNAKKNPLKYHEDVVVFCRKGQHTYNPQMIEGKPYKKVHRNDNKEDCVYGKSTRKNGDVFKNAGIRYPSSVIPPIANPSGRGQLHPTQKPVALMEYLIKTYTNEGETVLDFTMGSGTTLVACKRTNRNGIGIEQVKKYCEIAIERLKNENLMEYRRS